MHRGLLIASLVSVAIAAAAADAPRGSSPITRETVLEQMNIQREASGLGPLREDFRLSQAAEDRMKDMIELGYWSHQSPRGYSPFIWTGLRGYRFASAGENLATGFETAELLVTSWMESKGHRENILGEEFVDVGIAIIEGSTTRRAAGHSVVVMFARERIAEPITRRGSKDRSRETTPRDRR